MYTDKDYVFDEIRKGVKVHVNEWTNPDPGFGITLETANRKIENYIPYFVSKFRPNFCNKLYDSDSDDDTLIPRLNTTTYKQIIMEERFLALKKCKLGDRFLEIKDPGDIVHFDYESGDGISESRGYWTQTSEGLWVIQLISAISASTRVWMAVLEYPRNLEDFPKVFEPLFIMKATYDLLKQKSTDMGQYSTGAGDLKKDIKDLEQELAQLYYSSSDWEYEFPTPYQNYTRSDDYTNVR